jgi:hypothetical protein
LKKPGRTPLMRAKKLEKYLGLEGITKRSKCLPLDSFQYLIAFLYCLHLTFLLLLKQSKL